MNNFACFGRFLSLPMSNWANFFCNESGILRNKFRLPTTYWSDNVENPLFSALGHFQGVWGGEILMELWIPLHISHVYLTFGVFWANLAIFFCNESGIRRQKFRLTTTYWSDNVKNVKKKSKMKTTSKKNQNEDNLNKSKMETT